MYTVSAVSVLQHYYSCSGRWPFTRTYRIISRLRLAYVAHYWPVEKRQCRNVINKSPSFFGHYLTAVASLRLMSRGAATDGVTYFFPKN